MEEVAFLAIAWMDCVNIPHYWNYLVWLEVLHLETGEVDSNYASRKDCFLTLTSNVSVIGVLSTNQNLHSLLLSCFSIGLLLGFFIWGNNVRLYSLFRACCLQTKVQVLFNLLLLNRRVEWTWVFGYNLRCMVSTVMMSIWAPIFFLKCMSSALVGFATCIRPQLCLTHNYYVLPL